MENATGEQALRTFSSHAVLIPKISAAVKVNAAPWPKGRRGKKDHRP